MITKQVKHDIRDFIVDEIDDWRHNALESMHDDDCPEDDRGVFTVTFATDDGSQWNYQTGDNSFTGGAYGLKHWAVVYVSTDSTVQDVFTDVINEWMDLMEEWA